MARIINAVAETAGVEKRTEGHFLTAQILEEGRVKIQILRRSRGDQTVLAIGIACDAGSAAQNRANADYYTRILRRNRPPGTIEEFPRSAINQYRTIVRPIPAGNQELGQYVDEAAAVLNWFRSLNYGKESET